MAEEARVPHAPSEQQLAELHAAFRVFTQATASLEGQYRALQEHADALRHELEDKKRALDASIERQRCLETQALRHGRLAAMGEMAATLAHEVRNPLGAMELCIKLLADEVRSQPSAARLADQVATGIADLNHLVSNILDYTRLPEPRLAPTAMGGLLDEVVVAAAPALGSRVRIERGGVSDVVWPVDRGLLMQTLLNLVRNAGEAMGGAGTLTLALEPAGRWLRIVVADDGPGISAANVETVFAPFFTTKERGTGLGLAVARAAVAAHGGTLALRPGDGGATFVLTLPQAPVPGGR
jgi:two-component system sensor histidine kinase FlrB